MTEPGNDLESLRQRLVQLEADVARLSAENHSLEAANQELKEFNRDMIRRIAELLQHFGLP
jgi:cell division protein FtsB